MKTKKNQLFIILLNIKYVTFYSISYVCVLHVLKDGQNSDEKETERKRLADGDKR